MTDNENQTLSAVRMEKADENLIAAKSLISSGSYRIATTRTYYAVFHAMRSVLALDGIDRKHHSAVIAEFRRLYIRTGLISKSQSETISKLSDLRSDSDYDDFFIVTEEEAIEALNKAEVFVSEIKNYLIKRNG